MWNHLRNLCGAAALTVLAAGCGTAPPGEGLTNGPSPAVLRAEEKPGVRDDLHEPPVKSSDVAPAQSGDTSAGASADSSKEPKGAPPSK